MWMPRHDIIGTAQPGMTPRRAMIIGGVGLLHVMAIYALMNGLVAKVIDIVQPPIEVTVDTTTPPKTPLVPPAPTMAKPTDAQLQPPTIQPPVIDIASDTPSTITVTATPPNTAPPVDSGATGVTSTHSTPPYPAEARALSHQGTVLLQLAVSAQGDVTSANVVQSSGFPELDSAAVTWVVAHWKYKPALQGGFAMPSQTQAAVKFDLKLARR